MRQIALPIVICLVSLGCAASEESEPADDGNTPSNGHAGSLNVGGVGSGSGGAGNNSAGTAPGSAGSGVATGGSGNGSSGTGNSAGSAPVAGTGSGGAAPGGGTCKMSVAAATGMPLLIDDFEDGNADVMANEGRVGGWFLATDTTGTTTPTAPIAPMPEAGGNPGKAMHVSGSGLTGWGASLSAMMTVVDGCYDASKFTGITVMLKGTGSIWVSVLTAAVRGAPADQRNHYKKQVTLSAEWTPVTINFTELMQPGGWGVIVPFDVTKVYGVDFGPATAPPTPTAFDFWVDNLSFK